MRQAEAYRRLAGARVARLATVRPDGSPHLVPVVYAIDGQRLVSAIDGKPKSGRPLARLANIGLEPRVCLLVDAYSEDWARLWWVRVDGLARILSTGAAIDRARVLLAAKYPQYAAVPPPGPVIAVAVERVVGWTAS